MTAPPLVSVTVGLIGGTGVGAVVFVGATLLAARVNAMVPMALAIGSLVLMALLELAHETLLSNALGAFALMLVVIAIALVLLSHIAGGAS